MLITQLCKFAMIYKITFHIASIFVPDGRLAVIHLLCEEVVKVLIALDVVPFELVA